MSVCNFLYSLSFAIELFNIPVEIHGSPKVFLLGTVTTVLGVSVH